MSTGALVDTITTPAPSCPYAYAPALTMVPYAPGLYMYGSYPYIMIFDPVNNTYFPANAHQQKSTSQSGSLTEFMGYNDNLDAIGTYFDRLTAFKNPLYLATINNLDSPVTKTAAKTMKITYTLTETA